MNNQRIPRPKNTTQLCMQYNNTNKKEDKNKVKDSKGKKGSYWGYQGGYERSKDNPVSLVKR